MEVVSDTSEVSVVWVDWVDSDTSEVSVVWVDWVDSDTSEVSVVLVDWVDDVQVDVVDEVWCSHRAGRRGPRLPCPGSAAPRRAA